MLWGQSKERYLVAEWDIEEVGKMDSLVSILIRILGPTLTVIILWFVASNILGSNSKEYIANRKKEHIVVKLPKAYLWVGAFCTVFFVFITCAPFLFPDVSQSTDVWVIIIFLMFALVGAFLALEALVWRIEIFRNESYFLYRTVFFKTYKIQYGDCISYKIGDRTNSLKLKAGKKTFHIDCFSVNFDYFLDMLKQHKVKRTY